MPWRITKGERQAVASPHPPAYGGPLPLPRRGEGKTSLARGLAIAALVIVLDQLSKLWILDRVAAAEVGIPLLRVADFFDIVLVWNRGVSFGLFNNGAALNAVVFSLLAAAIV